MTRVANVCGGVDNHVNSFNKQVVILIRKAEVIFLNIADLYLVSEVLVLLGEVELQNLAELFLASYKADNVHSSAKKLAQNV